MVSIGNKSKFSTKEICQACGKCCTTFSWTDSEDQALRFSWMDDKDIIVEDTDLKFPDGEPIKVITIKRGCKMLEKKAGKYSCKAYHSKRPDFCNTYPDLIFDGIKGHRRDELQKAIDFEKQHCPIFKTLTVDEVLRKLYKPHRPKIKGTR
jgi:Fe-S-cluster containining protein